MKLTNAPSRLLQASLMAAVIAASPQVAGQVTAGITDDTVKIGISAPMSGVVASLGAVSMGIELKAKAVNAAGGVKMADGKTRKIQVVIYDDAIEPQRTMTNVRKLVEQDQVFALVGIAGTNNNQMIRSYTNQNKVPNLFLYSAVYEFGDEQKNPWNMSLVPSFTTEAAVYAEYLKRTKPDAKVGLLYTTFEGGLNFLAGFKAAIAGSKIQLVSAQGSAGTDPTVDTQMTNLRASGADTLIVADQPRHAALAVKYAAESGWAPKTIVYYAASSVSALRPAGLENAKGVLTAQFVKPVDSPDFATDPGVLRYLADHERFKPKFEKWDSLGQMGYLTGEALVWTLQNMKTLSREAAMEAARSMNAVTLDLLYPGVALTTKRSRDGFAVESMQLFEFDGFRYKPVGGLVQYEGKTPRL